MFYADVLLNLKVFSTMSFYLCGFMFSYVSTTFTALNIFKNKKKYK